MPYSVWTEKLARVVDVWYKTLQGCCGDQRKAACMLGLEEQSFEVLGKLICVEVTALQCTYFVLFVHMHAFSIFVFAPVQCN